MTAANVDRPAGSVLCGRYRIVRRLGAGGMGTVFLAEHIHLHRQTAIKILRQDLLVDPAAEGRFRREARLAAQLNHAAVAQVYDFDITSEGEFFIAMEYVAGTTLANRIAGEGALPMSLALTVLTAVGGGLDAAHALGILHRDVKPANIMLTPAGDAKLLDFGIARPVDGSEQITSAKVVLGTPTYMSPEQLAADVLTSATDIYSLGLVFFEMVCGSPPHARETFDELRAKRLTQTPPRLERFCTECPPPLGDVLARALAVNPAERWASSGAFAKAAADAVRHPAPHVPSPGEVREVEQRRRWEAHFARLPLAGRDQEVDLVRNAWASARMGTPTLLWIEGDQGAGKSAFFELARRDATADGAIALVAHGYHADAHTPLTPWQRILESASRLTGARQLEPGALNAMAIDALIAARRSAAPEDRRAAFQRTVDLLHAIATDRLLFVGIDGLDECDDDSAALFAFVAHHLAARPILLVGTGTSGPLSYGRFERNRPHSTAHAERTVRVALRPLSRTNIATWLQAVLPSGDAHELAADLVADTEGNPFYIEQLLRAMLEEGEFGLTQPRAGAVRDLPVPDTIAGVIASRLACLSPSTRDVLAIAAVVGREFSPGLVADLSELDDAAVYAALDEAELSGILAAVDHPTALRYRFTHGKIAAVHAGSMSTQQRMRVHARIAEWLERVEPTSPGIAGHHWFEAGDAERAAEAALRAARQALAAHNYDDALVQLDLAARAARANPRFRCDALELRGDVLGHLDRQQDSVAAYEEAREGTDDTARQRKLRIKALRGALLAGSEPADRVLADLKTLRHAKPDDDHVRGLLHVAYAEALLHTGDLVAAVAAAEDALEGAGTIDETQRAELLVVLGTAHLRQGHLDAALPIAERAGDRYAALDDPYGQSVAAMLRASIEAQAGNEREAALAREEARQFAAHLRRATDSSAFGGSTQ